MLDRRNFLTGAAATVLTVRKALGAPQRKSERKDNLIPSQPGKAPNYWCTWAAQNYMYGHRLPHLDPSILEGDSGGALAREAIGEQQLFGINGWAKSFYPQVRSDAYLLLDDGWETGGTATFELDPKKFPSFSGAPVERMAALNRKARQEQWRGIALWCRNPPGGEADRRLEDWSAKADIGYWKIDIGDPSFRLTALRDQTRLPLTLEHVHGELPVNGDWRNDGRFGSQPWGSRRLDILAHTDVYRTYDVTSILSLPTTLDRVAEMLKGAEGHPEVSSLLNVEDEVYVAAVLGCTMGILRHPLEGLRPGPDADLFFNGPRRAKRRMDEVVRALRWQRLAQPFSPGSGTVKTSQDILTDSWRFERGQTWQNDLVDATVRQGAPACITRNLDLPSVQSAGEKPFVFAARFPNGAVAIGAQQRTKPSRAWYMPEAHITLHVGNAPGPFGIFGDISSLTLVFDRPLGKQRVQMQDLAGDRAEDITTQISQGERRLQLSRSLIRKFGLSAATPGDLSSPGLVLVLEDGAT
ncbi:hypothetical protein [Edaphobacter bradus]|uniref:hypothetical protein n=1 Tax=Edaphobacter bradus TaxID=2259016 RepID=UPI0021DFB80A|nr:hypothetical protein [Edaphobacter bradus]